MLRLVIAVLVLTLCSVSFAGSKAPFKRFNEGSVRGVGAGSCGTLIENFNAESRPFTQALKTAHTAFFSGYVLAANDYTRGNHDLHVRLDYPSIRAFAFKFCSANPLSDVDDAARALVDSLSKKR